ITGGSIGRCAIVPDDFDIANVNQHVLIIRLVDEHLRKFLHSCLISNYIQKMIMDVQVGVSREGLSATKLMSFLVPIPPLVEQQRIVEKAEELLQLCDRLN
ncbi:MAG: restriction endonuclease subunit S, partial [Eubacteriales bacterium]